MTRRVAIGAGVGWLLPDWIWFNDSVAAIPASEGYPLVEGREPEKARIPNRLGASALGGRGKEVSGKILEMTHNQIQ